MATLDKILNQDYENYRHNRMQNVNGYAVAKIHITDSGYSSSDDKYRYLIEKDGWLAIYDASKVEFLDIQIPDISESTLVLERENPEAEGQIRKEIPLKNWQRVDAKEFLVRVADASYWNVDYEPNSKFWESDHETKDLPGAYETIKYSVHASCLRNFNSLPDIKYNDRNKGTPNEITEANMMRLLEYFEDKNIWYYPKRDIITIKGLNEEKEKQFKELFRRNIPSF